MQDIDCPPTTSKAKLRFESVEFSDIPGQSKLFLDYQNDPASLRNLYPALVTSHTQIGDSVGAVLEAYSVNRTELCAVLEEQNRNFNAGEKTLDHINLLRRPETVAVVTGQQTGLFTGPLYTIYKALSAIKMAACLRDRGVDAVPVFWAATEDHDFDEIAHAYVIGQAGDEIEIKLPVDDRALDHSVGSIKLPKDIADLITTGLKLPDTEFSDAVRSRLVETWHPDATIGIAFCRHLQQLFREYGLIVVDPGDARLKRAAAPVFESAIAKAEQISSALQERSSDLVADGYHAQVLINPDYVPLFYHTDDGARRAVRRDGSGKFRISGTHLEFDTAGLAESARNHPERFSAAVMLRPIVQDYLLPTICYFGGAAEIAYFAQVGEVYRILERPVTPVLHRQSFTLVEPKHARTLEKYDLKFADLFNGFENLLPKIVGRFLNPSASRQFADSEADINTELDRLDHELSKIDPTLAANLATRRRKILYHIAAIRKKFQRVQIERDEIVNRQLRSLFAAILPNGELQERRLNITSFTSRYGEYVIDWIYESIDLDERGHRLLYL